MKMRREEFLFLSGLITEQQLHESDNDLKHYMFFSNLKSIKEKVDKLLSLDPGKVDEMLSDGHDWAGDHVTSSRDDIEEVYNWIMGEYE